MIRYRKIVLGLPNDPPAKYFSEHRRNLDCWMLIKELCVLDPAARLTSKPGGVQNLKDHYYYRGFDWHALRHRKLQAPYLPDVRAPDDMKNFKYTNKKEPAFVEYIPMIARTGSCDCAIAQK